MIRFIRRHGWIFIAMVVIFVLLRLTRSMRGWDVWPF